MTRLRSRRRCRHRRCRHRCCWWITDQATAKPDAINGHFPRCSIKWIHTHRWEDYSNSLKFYIASGYTFGFRSVTLRPFKRKMNWFCLPASRCWLRTCTTDLHTHSRRTWQTNDSRVMFTSHRFHLHSPAHSPPPMCGNVISSAGDTKCSQWST